MGIVDLTATTRVGQRPPTVFAHRGASGYRPEHTLASYELAIRQCADVIRIAQRQQDAVLCRIQYHLRGTELLRVQMRRARRHDRDIGLARGGHRPL